ncbi:MAG: sigma-70 family RNA polymerase sigma factor [Thermoanaerobaculia bacterium]
MSTESRPDGDLPVTELLQAWRRGETAADDKLLELVYGELKRLAAAQLRGERQGHTLEPTALVHEAYLRLAGQKGLDWRDRSHFFGLAATMMRRILVDHARARLADKRAHLPISISLIGDLPGKREEAVDEAYLLDLDRAIDRLAAAHPRPSRVVELRYFAGLEVEEVAAVLDLSPRTVKRDWAFARAWLLRALQAGPPKTVPSPGDDPSA